MTPPPTVSVADSGLPQGFSVVLVLGDLQGGTTQDNVPPAARKALSDMKDFLPYKSYRLLDVQWTLCCGRGTSATVSRLRGPDGHDYELTLEASRGPRRGWASGSRCAIPRVRTAKRVVPS